MLVVVLGHATLLLFFISFVASVTTAIQIRFEQHVPALVSLCANLLALIVATSLLYTVAQAVWLFNDNDNSIASYEVMLWTVAEWLVAITLLSFTFAIRVFLNWKKRKPKPDIG